MTTQKKKRPAGGSRRRIVEMASLFVIGSVILIKLLQTGAAIAVPYTQDNYIQRYAREYDLDKSLVAAVIYQESRYDKDAVSRVGAAGLMQIMPETADWIAGRLKISYAPKDLFDPEYNIRMGTYYLSYLLERYDGNTRNALAAYNAGPGNVDSWLANPKYAKDGQLIAIPFEETRKYVDKVLEMKDTYRSMYSKEFSLEAP